MKPTPESISKLQRHYERQQKAAASIRRWLKKTKPETVAEAIANNLTRPSPFPLALVRSLYRTQADCSPAPKDPNEKSHGRTPKNPRH